VRRLFLIAICVSSLTSTAKSAVIYSQTNPEEPGASFASSNIAGAQKIADNFLVGGTGQYSIRSLRVIGGYGTLPVSLPDDNFQVVFLNDISGIPGSPVLGGDFSISAAVSRTPTGGQLLNGVGIPIEIVLDLGSGVTLDYGSEYWISISNNPMAGSGWAWARAHEASDSVAASTVNNVATGPWIVGSSSRGGMWFELNDDNIPEPNSVVILLSVTPIALLSRRSRLPGNLHFMSQY